MQTLHDQLHYLKHLGDIMEYTLKRQQDMATEYALGEMLAANDPTDDECKEDLG